MAKQPLAFLLRPESTKDIIGQQRVLGDQGLIKRMVEKKFPTSLIFYGPPGTGKTSFATALAKDLGFPYASFNATLDKKETLNKIMTESLNHDHFVLIIDEIHRMNKDKQDLLLEHLEKGNLTVFFTTTENPFFVMNPAIRSRAHIVKVEPISHKEMFGFFKKLLKKPEFKLKIDDEALDYLTQISAGDLRSALNNLELLLNLYPKEKITLDFVTEVLPLAQVKGAHYGDDMADLKSALQKSIRGSDVDASLYYFARLAAIGDFETLMRRMVVMAYEDIGLANPQVPPRVYSACEAFRHIGMPEGIIPLGLAIVEMALSEKSNSAYIATKKAMADVESGHVFAIPEHLRDTHYKSAKKLNHGQGYLYPHDFPNDWVKQNYLPPERKDIQYYLPKTSSAYEKKVIELYEKMKK
ncbi:putative ATPase [Entomoplasma freundtii]|uniref:Recombination factor protein RarA n=1 Tax=Entomoplasma freundtii TaxID=74700 RepID=A0A2K8NRD5_9MOLU|nr:replication-associated recombination protein A [Entomoplasma freundtii]ATZ16392.1 recombination factor protein RarA [Entomoplasma freundtii]TDY56569.1 putative ATPase [Entomoplasma freundtii]